MFESLIESARKQGKIDKTINRSQRGIWTQIIAGAGMGSSKGGLVKHRDYTDLMRMLSNHEKRKILNVYYLAKKGE